MVALFPKTVNEQVTLTLKIFRKPVYESEFHQAFVVVTKLEGPSHRGQRGHLCCLSGSSFGGVDQSF